jgi:hypothetical protein
VRLAARQLCGEHTRQGAGQNQAIGQYPTGELPLFAPGLTFLQESTTAGLSAMALSVNGGHS